jgi:hypothetical protein
MIQNDLFSTVYNMRPAAIQLLQSMTDSELFSKNCVCFRLSLHYFHKEAFTISQMCREDYFMLMENICDDEPNFHIN